MDNIVITNTIAEDKISINFDLQDGNLSLTSLDLSTFGDIELNPLIIKLAELIDLNKKIKINYVDSQSILETDSKTKLVKETLDKIFTSFNLSLTIEDDNQDLF